MIRSAISVYTIISYHIAVLEISVYEGSNLLIESVSMVYSINGVDPEENDVMYKYLN